MVKKLECDYIFQIRKPKHYYAHFLFVPTYNKASVSLTLDGTSCYIQECYMASN